MIFLLATNLQRFALLLFNKQKIPKPNKSTAINPKPRGAYPYWLILPPKSPQKPQTYAETNHKFYLFIGGL
jgi:hypothetical protein